MTAKRPVRIGNASGFYGDRFAAVRDLVEGADIDVLTGDYLAELTLYLLHKARLKNPDAGYATTFLSQLEHVLGTCLDRGIRIVANAGGLNPPALAREITALAGRLGLSPRVAFIDGDDVLPKLAELQAAGHPLTNLDTGRPLAELGIEPVTANAYLGGWAITRALEAGSDIVVTGRVTDASLVTGPAAWWHGWAPTDYDRLAGAVVAGHIIECGPQATGGNYSFAEEVVDTRYPGSPIAEVADDGSSVISKTPDSGGLVSVGTVTAQLLYEIGGPAYGGPDVTTWFDTITLTQAGVDRVAVSGTRGTPPSGEVKVAINYTGGYRNSMTAVLTGLDIPAKAERAERMLFDLLGGRDSFAATDVRLLRADTPDADSQDAASAHLVFTVKDPDQKKVGRAFSNAVFELYLGGVAGFHTSTPPSGASAYGVYWPTMIPATATSARIVYDDGREEWVGFGAGDAVAASMAPAGPAAADPSTGGATIRVPLGCLIGARSGDKGGNANIGLWARSADAFEWLRGALTVQKLRELVPEIGDLTVRRCELPNLHAINFVVVGILGEGVASSTRPDPQAKGLAEFVRSRSVEVPERLLDPATRERLSS